LGNGDGWCFGKGVWGMMRVGGGRRFCVGEGGGVTGGFLVGSGEGGGVGDGNPLGSERWEWEELSFQGGGGREMGM